MSPCVAILEAKETRVSFLFQLSSKIMAMLNTLKAHSINLIARVYM